MTDRRERIPADEVKESKRWNLPFWTEPQHLVQNDEPEEEVLVEEEEVEVEPFTAEQLEAIRQEAYNEGLEQGLVEGRQKGEKLGYDEGFTEGQKAGEMEGKKLGFDAGFEQGEKQAFENTTKEQAEISQRYEKILQNIQQDLSEHKQSLNDVLPEIILSLAKAVVNEELTQGSEHIINLVQQALNALPIDSGDITIEVNPKDLPFVEAAIEQGEFEGKVQARDQVEAGGCRVHTRYSSVDFTLSERWQAIEKQYHHQVHMALRNVSDDTLDNLEQSQESFDEDLPEDSGLSEPEVDNSTNLDVQEQPNISDPQREDEVDIQSDQRPPEGDEHEPEEP